MEYYAAQKIREAWNNKPCEHPVMEKEYYVGAFLVNWVCPQCGKEFTISEKLELDLSRSTAPSVTPLK
jgi:hypothetical protein